MARAFLETHLKSIHLERAGRAVLRGIDWSIRPGQHWILAGANGAGKTQLLKLVAGSVWPEPEGRPIRRYRLRGVSHSTPLEVQQEIAYLGPERQDRYERYGWNHPVVEIVGTGLHRTDIPLNPLSAADRRKIHALLERLRISHLARREFLTLSYGERRLVLLARALASRPRLLLLDELLNGLDADNRARALQWLESSRGSALPWVLSTHRLEDVPASVTHALILERGRAAYRGPLVRKRLSRWLSVPRQRRAQHDRLPSPRRHRAGMLVRLVHASVYLEERCVLQDISFEVRRGQCWVVHGANGSGKTTLLRTVYGDHAVAAGGRIERRGIVPGVPLEVFKRRVGLVAPHLQSLQPQDLTVREVVQSGRHASIGLSERPTAADRSAAKRTLAQFGLASRAGRAVGELSYGQLRRLLFARAWIAGPDLLLLDEPFAGLDPRTRAVLVARLAETLKQGVAALLATHHREEWPQAVSHEIELVEGRAIYSGPVRRGRLAA